MARRTATVTLEGGAIVLLQEWSWTKLLELQPLMGEPKNYVFVIEQSLQEADRKKLEDISLVQVTTLLQEITKLNRLWEVSKNLAALGKLLSDGPEGQSQSTPEKPSTQ